MKSLLIIFTLFSGSFALFNRAETMKVDVNKSKVSWTGKKFTGEHSGSVKIKSGTLEADAGKLTGGMFVIDMSTIENTDIKDVNYKAKLEGHLRSADFFGVEKYPTAVFKMTNARSIKGNKYQIDGNLTIKNVSDKVSFPAYVNVADGKITAKADIEVDRTKYDIKFKSSSFFDSLGDGVIYDDFTLSVFLVSE